MKTKLWLEVNGSFVIGDGGLRLLQGIERLGSLAEAVRAISWSYRHAWGYLRHAEQALGTRLVETRPGRGSARGMALTAGGRLLLERLLEIRGRLDEVLGPTGPTAEDVAARGSGRTARQNGRRP